MHSYLAVPEPVHDDIHWAKRLFHEIFRSMMKSSGHTTASFFDHMTVNKPKTPEGQ